MKKATRAQTKNHNKTLVLNAIYKNEDLSRADLSRLTHLTRSTVSDIVSELIEEGLVVELGYGQPSGGKPPVLLEVDKEARQIIGLDLASGEFRGALVNLRGEVQERVSIAINERSGDVALELVYELLEQLIGLAKTPVIGIGIGAPGLMDSEKGIVHSAVNLDWENLPIRDILCERYQLPVHIANDSQVSALAEYNFGDHERMQNLLVVKIGRGVGSGIVINQQLYQGDGFGAGEIGHIKVDEDGELCRCGNTGCLETKISSRALRQRVQAMILDHPDSGMQAFAKDIQAITLDEILAAYQAGVPEIVEIVEETGASLGKALAYMVSALNIHQVIVAGSVSQFGDGIVLPAASQFQSRILPNLASSTEIKVSDLGEEIVILGAAGMVLQYELGIM
ncbi:MAG: ROK family transcriptional regulator [Anaerolineales bacterium]|nr:ROK family transcriptional regulator [Anaerolineales bacterium]